MSTPEEPSDEYKWKVSKGASGLACFALQVVSCVAYAATGHEGALLGVFFFGAAAWILWPSRRDFPGDDPPDDDDDDDDDDSDDGFTPIVRGST